MAADQQMVRAAGQSRVGGSRAARRKETNATSLAPSRGARGRRALSMGRLPTLTRNGLAQTGLAQDRLAQRQTRARFTRAAAGRKVAPSHTARRAPSRGARGRRALHKDRLPTLPSNVLAQNVLAQRTQDAGKCMVWSGPGLQTSVNASGDARANLGGRPAPRPPGDRRRHGWCRESLIGKF